jgi:hypothetical protein
MGSTHFLTKRLPRVGTEMSLLLAYNFKRVIRTKEDRVRARAKRSGKPAPMGTKLTICRIDFANIEL